MAINEDDLNAFHQFALRLVQKNQSVESLDELLDLWHIEHPSSVRTQEDIAAVRAAIRDMEDGDRGQSAFDNVRDLRQGLVSTPGSE